MFAELEEPARVLSGGMYVPESRKDFMLLMRRRDEAEGERRMMGSGRRPDFLDRFTRAGLGVMVVAAEA